MWNSYYTVATVPEALARLAENAGHARLIAGGTDLLIELERGLRTGIDTLIDISRIPSLNGIQLDPVTGLITLGALVTHNDLVASPLIIGRAFPLAQAAWEIGAPQIRNRGTVAGNLITASPANDTITPLWALDASVTLTSLSGERTLPIADFYLEFRKTALRPDEMLTAIHLPALTPEQRGMFIKLGLRRAQAISVVNVAVVLRFDGTRISDARIALGSVAPTIIRVSEAEQTLIGRTLTPETIREAATVAGQTPTPIDDVRSTAEYRSEMVKVLVSRALQTLADHGERKNWPGTPPLLNTHEFAPEIHSTTWQHTPDRVLPPIQTTINGTPHTLTTGHDKTLLRLLRDECHLPGTKEGCAEGECGACTIFLDGAAVMACMVPAPRADGSRIVTVEGLSSYLPHPSNSPLRQQRGENQAADMLDSPSPLVERGSGGEVNSSLHPVQRAFIEAGAVQCGYCTPGFLMAGAKLLEEIPDPTPDQIAQGFTGNLCRCTGYYKIIEALQNARKDVSDGQAS